MELLVKLQVPDGEEYFRFPPGLDDRLQRLLDKQDQGEPLTEEERREAEGLVEVAETLSILRGTAQLAEGGPAHPHAAFDAPQDWITPEEAHRERRRLIEAGLPADAPEFDALRERVGARDDFLYESYGKPLLAEHRGRWIAIALDGRVEICDTPGQAAWAGTHVFGEGRFALRKLDDFPGFTTPTR
jgi:hypothetical protein